jgi:hypothetical protein
MSPILLIAALLIQGTPVQAGTGVVTGQLRSRDGQPAAGIRIGAVDAPETNVPGSIGSALIA